jgi:hypothetical protein
MPMQDLDANASTKAKEHKKSDPMGKRYNETQRNNQQIRTDKCKPTQQKEIETKQNDQLQLQPPHPTSTTTSHPKHRLAHCIVPWIPPLLIILIIVEILPRLLHRPLITLLHDLVPVLLLVLKFLSFLLPQSSTRVAHSAMIADALRLALIFLCVLEPIEVHTEQCAFRRALV